MNVSSNQVPTFLYRKTNRGIITSTYPVISKFKYGESQFEYFDYCRGVKAGLWHPDVEFVFLPKKNIDTYTYNNTNYNSIHNKIIYPISKSHLIEGSNYFPDLDGANIYWGSEITRSDFHKTKDKFESEILLNFFNWYNEIGKKSKYELKRELNHNWYCDNDLVKHKEIAFSKDKVSFHMLKILLNLTYLKAYIKSGELLELNLMSIKRCHVKNNMEFYDPADFDYYETDGIINIRFTKEFQIDFPEYLIENKIKQDRPDGINWKDWNSETKNYQGDPLFRYYLLTEFDHLFSNKYFATSNDLDGDLVMYSKTDFNKKKINVQMSEQEIWNENQIGDNEEDRNFWRNSNPNDWMGDSFDEFVDFD